MTPEAGYGQFKWAQRLCMVEWVEKVDGVETYLFCQLNVGHKGDHGPHHITPKREPKLGDAA